MFVGVTLGHEGDQDGAWTTCRNCTSRNIQILEILQPGHVDSFTILVTINPSKYIPTDRTRLAL